MSKRDKSIDAYRVDGRGKWRLKDVDPHDRGNVASEAQGGKLLARDIGRLAELQDKLYAQDRWALLLVFQAMDAAGKDSTIKHVMSGVNPQGCEVHSFKAPSIEELDHDFMWRTTCRLPRRGHIGIFNRSYYEEVLVVRVHPEVLAHERMPTELVTKHLWKERYEDINAFERYIARNGVVVRKFFLHVSKKEQRKRFLARLDDPEKNWKFSPDDVAERQCWSDYMDAYEEMIQATATEHAPWFVVPADNKWFTHYVVASAVIEALEELELDYPKVDSAMKKRLRSARSALEDEK
jgi:PPK2 family polyphosphate:nucleotide phosphotransferase